MRSLHKFLDGLTELEREIVNYNVRMTKAAIADLRSMLGFTGGGIEDCTASPAELRMLSALVALDQRVSAIEEKLGI